VSGSTERCAPEQVTPERFGVSSKVWFAHQKACEDLFQPGRHDSALWLQHWRQYEKIADSRTLNGQILGEDIRAALHKCREEVGQALARDDHKLFNQIADFIQHGEPNDGFPEMAPIICAAFRQLLDEWQASPNKRKSPITKRAVKVRASRIVAANLVRKEPEERKARLLEQRAESILKGAESESTKSGRKGINWARELKRVGLGDLGKAKSGRPKSRG
jgi:hypothetical protein